MGCDQIFIKIKQCITTPILTYYKFFCSYFANLADSIATNSDGKKDEFHTEKLQKLFPDFLWLSRDNHLQNVDDKGHKISPTDHLLKNILVRSDNPNPTPHDMVVRALTMLFPSIHCIQMPPPAEDPLDENSKCNQKFDESVDESITFILNSLKPKLGRNNNPIDGGVLANLACEYCKAINKPNCIPNVELSWMSAIELMLHKLATELVKDYDEGMQSKLNNKLPIDEGPITTREKLFPIEDYKSIILDPSTLTLQSIHQFVFSTVCHCLKERMVFYMPKSSQASEYDSKHKILLDFREKIVTLADKGNNKVAVKGGSLQKFVQDNFISSKARCEEVFEKLYNEQLSNNKIDLYALGHSYNQKVKNFGPAKEEVHRNKVKAVPGAPQDVNLKIISESGSISLMVSWNEPKKNPEAVTDYDVNVSCSKQIRNEQYRVTQKGTELKIENLFSNTEYYVTICSFNGIISKKGECSERVQLTTPPGRPDKPKKPKIRLMSTTMGVVTIPALSEEEEHGSKVNTIRIIIANDVNQEFLREHNCSAEDRVNEYECTVDIPNTDECAQDSFLVVQVQLFNEAGRSDLSDIEKVPIANLIPGPPQNLHCESRAKEITVTWKAACPNSAAAAFYIVEFREVLGSWETKHTMYKEFSYTFSSLKPASIYFVRIGSGNRFHSPSGMSISELKVSTLPDRPNRPRQPFVQVDQQLRLPNKAWLVSPKLHKEEENGSPVQEVIVKQRCNNKGQWKVDSFEIQQGASDIRQPIELLNASLETNIIHFHVIMKNASGESDPSEPCTLEPSAMIPGPPLDLSTEISFSSVKLSWKRPQQNPASVDMYCIEMKHDDRWQDKTTVSYQELSVTVSDLLPKTTYHFRAYTKNKDNIRLSEIYSSSVMITTNPCKPKKPEKSGIRLEVINHDKAKLALLKPKFTESGSEVKTLLVTKFNENKVIHGQPCMYEISEKDLKNESDSLHEIISIDPCTHFIQIVLRNQVGPSDPSDFVGVAASSLIPGVPKNFEYIDQERWARQISLKWKPPDANERAAKKYLVEMESHDQLVEVAESRWRPVDYKYETNQNEHFAIISGLIPCTKYVFRMCAVNDRVNGQYTKNLEVTTKGCRPDIPHKPHVLQSDTCPDKAVVTIHKLEPEKENGSPVTKITIEVSANLQQWTCYNFDTSTINHQKVEIYLPNLKDIDLECNQFFFHVKMRNEFGQSGPSENVSLPFAVLRPGKVQELQANCERAHIIKLQWKQPRIHPALVSNYIIQKASHSQAGSSAAWKEEMLVDPSKDVEIITAYVTERRMNVECKLRVLAKNKDVNGPYIEKGVEIPDITPGKPANLRGDKVQPKRVKVRWQQPLRHKEAVFQYKLEVFFGKTDEPVGCVIFTKKLSKVITNLNPLTQYRVKVTAMNVNNKCSPSAETFVKTVLNDGWRMFVNGLTAGQAARRPDPDCDLLSSGDEGS